MMTQQLEVSILAAPLAAIDRRALSQAWYSALRYGMHEPRTIAEVTVWNKTSLGRPRSDRRYFATGGQCLKGEFSAAVVRSKAKPVSSGQGWCNPSRRSAPRSALAIRIERVFSDRFARPRRATFAIGRGIARVHVILQTNGTKVTLVALCRPEMRPIVARALAQARLALAARDVVTEARLGGAECF
jgi:hypothetical protein